MLNKYIEFNNKASYAIFETAVMMSMNEAFAKDV